MQRDRFRRVKIPPSIVKVSDALTESTTKEMIVMHILQKNIMISHTVIVKASLSVYTVSTLSWVFEHTRPVGQKPKCCFACLAESSNICERV